VTVRVVRSLWSLSSVGQGLFVVVMAPHPRSRPVAAVGPGGSCSPFWRWRGRRRAFYALGLLFNPRLVVLNAA
jgi:hypothetical protein